MARRFNSEEVVFTITAEQDDIPIRGNAIVSGDEDFDEKVARDIEEQLGQGNVWAWASVRVSASWAGFTGSDSLGACSYEDEAAFRKGGYLPQMLEAAMEDLLQEIKTAGWEVICTGRDVEDALKRGLKENAA